MARSPRAHGFSLVELLVALLFTGLLMAGMAQVFKTSLSNFASSGEVLSAARRNRSTIDLLYEDLNSAGMFLNNLSSPPVGISGTNPGFYIRPNEPVPGVGADGPATADQLFFYFDQPLPFEAALHTAAGKVAAQLVESAGSPTQDDNTFTIDCKDASYANLVKPGMSIVFKDYWESRYIESIRDVNGKLVTVIVGTDPTALVTGLGSADAPAKVKHIPGSGVLFFSPGQMVRYSIKMKILDPLQPTGVPCLVRDQGIYNSSGFVADAQLESVITENVSDFKIYLSANAGQSWAGEGETYSGFNAGWMTGIRADLDTQLGTHGRQDFKTTQGDENWFRQIPVLVRLDVTTRTAAKRNEYSNDPTTVAYRNITQSLVIVPRHFGLALK